jgi:hypothetical protein
MRNEMLQTSVLFSVLGAISLILAPKLVRLNREITGRAHSLPDRAAVVRQRRVGVYGILVGLGLLIAWLRS